VKNTGVQTNVVFSSTVQTLSKFEFDEDPKVKTSEGHFVEPNQEFHAIGDTSVLAVSAIYAGLKWAEDFDEKVANAKPVTLIEVCSTQKRRESIFETGNPQTNLFN
jgi:hypothetical protein